VGGRRHRLQKQLACSSVDRRAFASYMHARVICLSIIFCSKPEICKLLQYHQCMLE
jgi:hypothetical protein